MNYLTEESGYLRRVLRKVLILFLCILVTLPSFAFYLPQKATRQSALAAFERNDLEQALRQFSELSASYPKDPLYKYYCGVCFVKLNREPSRALSLLNDAVTGSATIRTVPDDGIFWLARAQQMKGMFAEAIVSFEKYAGQAGKKTAKENNVPDYIKQCQERKGYVEEAVVATVNVPVVKPEEEIQLSAVNESVIVVSAVPPEKPAEKFDSLLTAALKYQNRSDSLYTVAASLKTQLNVADGTSANDLKTKIQNTEKQALASRNNAEAAMVMARNFIGREQLPDTVRNEPQVLIVPVVIAKDTAKQIVPPAVPVAVVAKPEKEVYYEFEIVQKPVYKPGEKVIVNPDVPPGLIYRVQVAVFKNPVAPSYFKGITPVHGFRNPANGITTYYAGMFRKSADASKSLVKVRGLGFKDSFVSALMDKKTVSTDRAALLEKEWGAKPLYTINPSAPDTVPKTLVFRVEIKRSPKPLPADQVENMKKMAGTRGFDIIFTEKKVSIYLAGKFLTFKSASEYADLLIRNGYRDAKVVAYLGNSEMPVETAKQLFDEH